MRKMLKDKLPEQKLDLIQYMPNCSWCARANMKKRTGAQASPLNAIHIKNSITFASDLSGKHKVISVRGFSYFAMMVFCHFNGVKITAKFADVDFLRHKSDLPGRGARTANAGS